MQTDMWIVCGVLLVTLVLFVWGRWRYDLVSVLALLALCLAGIVPSEDAFSGFGHPAVITVAAILVITAALRNAGVVDAVISRLAGLGDSPTLHVGVLCLIVAVCSAFMNNVGALAMMMPVAIYLARAHGHPPAYILMPIAFASLLGGMTTLIGTPPNIIIATYRSQVKGASFELFDFALVGLGVAVVGIAFITLVGWRLLPARQGQTAAEDLFEIDQYLTELQIPEKSKAIEMNVGEIGAAVEAEIAIIGIARGDRRTAMPSVRQGLRAGDILLVEGDAEAIKGLTSKLQLELVGDKKLRKELMNVDDIEVAEAIVKPEAYIEGYTAGMLDLRRRFGVNLLGVARQGRRLQQRIRDIKFQTGDVLLLQGDSKALQEAFSVLGCLPLAQRGLKLGNPQRVALGLGLFAAAIAVITVGLLPAHIAFVACAALMVLAKLLTLRELYKSVDWPIIVLLGAMLPVGAALESTGGAEAIASGIFNLSGNFPAWVALGFVLVAVMFLSDIINNAAAAVLMAPIAINLAHGFGAAPDAFLMAVAVGASCAFLTPIGHQSNTLVFGPGGYRFSDYARMGLPLEIIIVVVSLPLLLYFWPLFP